VMEVVVKTRPMEPSSGFVLASMLSPARESYGLRRPGASGTENELA
jgi:hypothetical protein